MFTIHPPDKPLELRPSQTGPLLEFPVSVVAEEMFIRAIALWADNTALEGAAPTFQLKAPGGIITSVNAGSGDVDIPGDGGTMGTANCQRLPGDIYLVTIADINEDTGGRSWHLRIRNNSDQVLRFVWITSDKERHTHQPRLALPSLASLVGQTPVQFITVRNWGTAPVSIDDQPGTRIGGSESPVTLVSRPAQIAPHGVDHIVVRCKPVGAKQKFQHAFESNDKDPTHTTLLITVSPEPEDL